MKAIFYSVALLASAALLVNFATYWNGGLGEGLGYALVGGYGNTVPALIAIVASLIGLLKTFLTGKSGALAFLSGKLAGMVLAIAIVLGVFANAIVAYLKLQDTDGLPNVYVSILGSPVFEVVIVVCLVLPMFFRAKRQSEE